MTILVLFLCNSITYNFWGIHVTDEIFRKKTELTNMGQK